MIALNKLFRLIDEIKVNGGTKQDVADELDDIKKCVESIHEYMKYVSEQPTMQRLFAALEDTELYQEKSSSFDQSRRNAHISMCIRLNGVNALCGLYSIEKVFDFPGRLNVNDPLDRALAAKVAWRLYFESLSTQYEFIKEDYEKSMSTIQDPDNRKMLPNLMETVAQKLKEGDIDDREEI